MAMDAGRLSVRQTRAERRWQAGKLSVECRYGRLHASSCAHRVLRGQQELVGSRLIQGPPQREQEGRRARQMLHG